MINTVRDSPKRLAILLERQVTHLALQNDFLNVQCGLTVVLKLQRASESPEGLLKYTLLGCTSRVSESVCLG